MAQYPSRPKRDQHLVQIVDAALADATQRSGHWLACRPGCTQCCFGVFAINQLDAARLREGLQELERADPNRARNVRQRADESLHRLKSDFPGDPATGRIGHSKSDRQRFEDFANHEPCPALDPSTGLCDLYAFRPMTCRVFGPPVHTADGIGLCELCFQGASHQQIEACIMTPDPLDLESALLKRLHPKGETIVAFVLAGPLPE